MINPLAEIHAAAQGAKMELRVAVVVDDNYRNQLSVLAYQMAKFSRQKVELYIFFDQNKWPVGFHEESATQCRKLGLKLQLVPSDQPEAPSERQGPEHLRGITAPYLRLGFDRMEGRFLFLDIDVLLARGWEDIFAITPSDKKSLFAAATDQLVKNHGDYDKNQALISQSGRYFNAGVMLFFKPEISDSNRTRLNQGIAGASKLGFQFQDQCILNWVFGGFVEELPQLFNAQYFSRGEPKPLIYHFAGDQKPWHFGLRKSTIRRHGNQIWKYRFVAVCAMIKIHGWGAPRKLRSLFSRFPHQVPKVDVG
jgi:lipopolysaccharide biosynthesis glycosyltransferase